MALHSDYEKLQNLSQEQSQLKQLEDNIARNQQKLSHLQRAVQEEGIGIAPDPQANYTAAYAMEQRRVEKLAAKQRRRRISAYLVFVMVPLVLLIVAQFFQMTSSADMAGMELFAYSAVVLIGTVALNISSAKRGSVPAIMRGVVCVASGFLILSYGAVMLLNALQANMGSDNPLAQFIMDIAMTEYKMLSGLSTAFSVYGLIFGAFAILAAILVGKVISIPTPAMNQYLLKQAQRDDEVAVRQYNAACQAQIQKNKNKYIGQISAIQGSLAKEQALCDEQRRKVAQLGSFVPEKYRNSAGNLMWQMELASHQGVTLSAEAAARQIELKDAELKNARLSRMINDHFESLNHLDVVSAQMRKIDEAEDKRNRERLVEKAEDILRELDKKLDS